MTTSLAQFSSDQLALLRTIKASPDEDLPRLVYADWLEDNDQDAQAELIRLSCEYKFEISGFGESTNSINTTGPTEVDTTHFEHAAQLAKSCEKSWFAIPQEIEFDLSLCRGMITIFCCKFDDWIKHGKLICSLHPIQQLEITDKQPIKLDIWYPHFSFNYYPKKLNKNQNHVIYKREIFDLLKGGNPKNPPNPNQQHPYKWFVGQEGYAQYHRQTDNETILLAEKDLNNACLKWANNSI